MARMLSRLRAGFDGLTLDPSRRLRRRHLEAMVREGERAGLYEATSGPPPRIKRLAEFEALDRFESRCREQLGISGDEFLARYKAGEFQGCEDEDVVECRGAARLAGLVP